VAPFTHSPRTFRSKSDLDDTKPDGKLFSPMRLVLDVPEQNQVVSAQLTDRLVIGRGSPKRHPEIDLTEIGAYSFGISRCHAAFIYTDNTLYIEDLHSTNGTRVNGCPIEAGSPFCLRNGDELEIGHLRMIVRVVRPASDE